ncbi:phosphotransferase family protein [Paenibacillus sp. sgz500958]|uniref:phosphotransferase family protein n=1 Tax=Paenibacillus sp. sgz500958 TaxID=3242475 RepID=UPI0036D2555E
MQGKLIGEGRTAEVWEYGDHEVVKLYRDEIPEDQIRREFEISQYVYNQGIGTPKPIEIVTIEGRMGIVFQRIEGLSLLTYMGKQPWKIGGYATSMAELHHSLHKLEAAPGIGRQKEILRHNIIGAPILSVEEKSDIIAYLDKLPEGNKLCHGDFHPDNVLLDERMSVIDWMTGYAGEPAGDAARSVVMFSIGSMPPGTSFITKLMIGIGRSRLTKRYVKEYLKRSGISYKEINQWVLPVAAARLTEWLPTSEKTHLAKEVRTRLRSKSFRL